jgi:hypothetical protein
MRCAAVLARLRPWKVRLPGVHNVLLLCRDAGFYGVGIGSKSTGVSKHYWTVFDVPGVSLATT